jgi:hypothetical protein
MLIIPRRDDDCRQSKRGACRQGDEGGDEYEGAAEIHFLHRLLLSV